MLFLSAWQYLAIMNIRREQTGYKHFGLLQLQQNYETTTSV